MVHPQKGASQSCRRLMLAPYTFSTSFEISVSCIDCAVQARSVFIPMCLGLPISMTRGTGAVASAGAMRVS